MTLVEFLRARLDEDEAFHEGAVCRCGIDGGLHDPDCPRRVLAEVDAKRRIMDEYERWRDAAQIHHPGPDTAAAAARLGWALHALALPYADHADYDPAWRV